MMSSGEINAAPTKSLFISMLIKDIPLVPAITDLVDNSVDAARALRPDHHLHGLAVRLTVDPSEFRIHDNCAGMTADIARLYAFRFGRSDEAPATPHSVGRFGVGMKRALFKLGRHFTIESTTSRSRFVVDVDVDQWKKDDADWTFSFVEHEEDVPQSQESGTSITVTKLHPDVAEQLGLESVRSSLIREISSKQGPAIEDGLAMTINGIPVTMEPLKFLSSELLQPAYLQRTIGTSPESVDARIYVGIADSEPRDAGWYVFCNGRMILKADQSQITGWGEAGETKIPRFHNQFSRFRGYVFLDSDNSAALPWNTTKTSVDTESSVFRALRLDMIRLMRSVINFLNDLDKEKDTEEAALEEAVDKAQLVRYSLAAVSDNFRAPTPAALPGPKMGRVQYSKPVAELQKVMKALGVSSYKDAGEKTFEYFAEQEGI